MSTSVREIWAAIRGQDEDVPVVVGAILVYVLTFTLCLVLQRITNLLLPKALSVFMADFFFTMAICAYPYSHGTMRRLFGHVGYLSAAVPMATLSCMLFVGSASPLGVFRAYLKGKESLWRLGVRVVIQTVGAFLSFRLVYLIWSLEVTDDHRQWLKVTACETDLNVPVAMGFLLEFAATMYDTWLCEQQLFKAPFLDLVVKIFNGCLLVCGGVHLTGMYMHPAMASGMSWACEGTSTVEHIFVYWIGSFIGCYTGLWLHSALPLPWSKTTETVSAKIASKDVVDDATNSVQSKKANVAASPNNNSVLYVYHRKNAARVPRKEM